MSFRVSCVHVLTMYCLPVKLSVVELLECFAMVKKSSDSMDQKVDHWKEQSSTEHLTFHYEPMMHRKFADKIQRALHHVDCQLSVQLSAHKCFCKFLVSYKDDAMDEVFVKLTMRAFYLRTDDMDCQGLMKDLKVHLLFLYSPYQQETIF